MASHPRQIEELQVLWETLSQHKPSNTLTPKSKTKRGWEVCGTSLPGRIPFMSACLCVFKSRHCRHTHYLNEVKRIQFLQSLKWLQHNCDVKTPDFASYFFFSEYLSQGMPVTWWWPTLLWMAGSVSVVLSDFIFTWPSHSWSSWASRGSSPPLHFTWSHVPLDWFRCWELFVLLACSGHFSLQKAKLKLTLRSYRVWTRVHIR